MTDLERSNRMCSRDTQLKKKKGRKRDREKNERNIDRKNTRKAVPTGLYLLSVYCTEESAQLLHLSVICTINCMNKEIGYKQTISYHKKMAYLQYTVRTEVALSVPCALLAVQT